MADVEEQVAAEGTEEMATEAAEAEEDGDAVQDGLGDGATEVIDEVGGDDEETKETEEKTEKEAEKKKPKVRPFIPSRLEFRLDRIREQQERTVMIGPASLEDLVNMRLMDRIKSSQQFFIRFFKEEKKEVKKEANGDAKEGEEEEVKEEEPADDTPVIEEHRGHVEIRFASVEEADDCVTELADLREGLSVKRITYEYTKSDEYKDLRKIGSPSDNDGMTGNRSGRIVALTGLDAAVTREQITEKIPDAVDVMFPMNYGTNELKGRYVYIEITTLDKAKSLEGTFINFGDNKHKVYTLEDIPSLDNVIRRIDKERIQEPIMRPIEPAKKERMKTLLRYASHYEILEDVPKNKVEALKKRMVNLRQRLREDSRKNRAMGGGRGGPRGARGGRGTRGMRGAPRGGAMSAPQRRGNWNQSPRGGGFRGGRGGMGGGYGGGYDRYDGYGGGHYDEGYGYGGGYNDGGYGNRRYDMAQSSPRGGYRRGGGGMGGGYEDRGRKRTYSGQGPPGKRRQGMWFD